MQRAFFNQFSCAFKSTSSERASADAEIDSSEIEAASVSNFDEYWNFLHLTAAAEASATVSAKSDLTTFAEALVDVERLGRLKLSNA